jgi:hypothetical protein
MIELMRLKLCPEQVLRTDGANRALVFVITPKSHTIKWTCAFLQKYAKNLPLESFGRKYAIIKS